MDNNNTPHTHTQNQQTNKKNKQTGGHCSIQGRNEGLDKSCSFEDLISRFRTYFVEKPQDLFMDFMGEMRKRKKKNLA